CDACKTSCNEHIAHHLARAEKTVLDRSQWQPGHLSDLVIGQVARMPQHDEVAVRARQTLDNRIDLAAPLRTLVVLLGGRAAALDLYLICAVSILGLEAMRSIRIPPHMIDRGIVRDAIKPRREFIFGTIFVKRVVDLDENFLRDIE